MAYDDPEPSDADLAASTRRLVIRPLVVTDARQMFELLSEVEFLDEPPPKTVEMTRTRIETGRARQSHTPTYRRYGLGAFLADGTLAVMVSAVLTIDETQKVFQDPETGALGDTVQQEIRVAEVSTYVHKDHQRKGYGPEATAAVQARLGALFRIERRRATVHLKNGISLKLVRAAPGMELARRGDLEGYEVYEAPA